MTARIILLATALVVASCAAPVSPEPAEVEFAQLLLERADTNVARAAQPTAPQASAVRQTRSPPPARTRADAWRGIVTLTGEELAAVERAAASDEALHAVLAQPISAETLSALAVLRSPTVAAAQARYRAALTSYDQSEDLEDLVGLYRSFTRQLETRVGPQRSRQSTEMIAPAPNVSGLSAEIAIRRADAAFESLRSAIRDTVSDAWIAHADAERLFEARHVIAAEVELDDALLEVLRARLEAGSADQAGFLAFEARRERLRTELDVLERSEGVVRAAWNRLLSRPESAPLELAVGSGSADAGDSSPDAASEAAVIATALAENQELRAARLAAERTALALRMMESMALPHLDLGSSRFERGRTGEAGVQRGATFPAPGRGIMARADFGVRDAQVAEMRARVEASRAASDALRDTVRTRTREALFAVDSARRRLRVRNEELVPLAERSLESVRGSYESGDAGYLDLLESVRRLLDARLGRTDSRRDLRHARARLLRATGVDTDKGR